MVMLSWKAGENHQRHLKGPRESPGLLLPPFTGRETEGIKKNNEQRMWAGPLLFFSLLQTRSVHSSVLPLLSPEQMEVAKPARKLHKKLGHIPPAPLKYCCVHIPLQGSEVLSNWSLKSYSCPAGAGRGKHTLSPKTGGILCTKAGGHAGGCRNTANQCAEMPFCFLLWKHSAAGEFFYSPH